MAHELSFIDGRAQFIGRQAAWHALGDIIGRNFGWDDIVERAPLIAAPVELLPSYAVRDFDVIPFPDRYTSAKVLPDGTVTLLGDGLSSQYTIEQDEDAYNFGQDLSNQIGAPLVSAGSLRRGTQTFFTFDTGTVTVGGEDINTHLTILNGHEGRTSLQAIYSDTVVVCANTLALAQGGALQRLSIPHKGDVAARKAAMIALTRGAEARPAQIARTVETLQSIKLDVRHFDLVLDGLFPDADMAKPKAQAKAEIRSLFGAPVVGDFTGTGWGAVQAVNTWEMWSSKVRKGSNTDKDARAMRQVDALMGGGWKLTREATAKVLALV